MVTGKIKITNLKGVHLRPAMDLCTIAQQYEASIHVQNHGTVSNVKSVLNLLAASMRLNDEILIQCEGEDEEEALQAILMFFQEDLGIRL